MWKDKKTTHTILEAIGYSFFGTVFVLIFDLAKFILTSPQCVPNFSCDTYVGRGIPLGGVLIGAVFSVIFVNFLFGRIIKSEFTKWSFILTTTSITAILLQTAYLISNTDLAFEQIALIHFSKERLAKTLGLNLMVELFLILTPFTILFANRWIIIEKIKNKTALE
jgi:hypothetical protein